jgi:serine/threonine protein kinase
MKPEINYNYGNIDDIVNCDQAFISNFTVIKKISSTGKKGNYVVKDNSENIFFIKAKLNETVSEDEKHVYKLIKNIDHENIMKIHDIIYTEKLCYVKSQFYEGQTLNTDKQLSKNIITNILLQISKALKFMHSLGIIHGDIKLENILITNDDVVKLIDFDLSHVLNSQYYLSTHTFGTDDYIAPESFDMMIYSTKSDIWSLGITMYKLILKKTPFIFAPNKICNYYIKNNFKYIDIKSLINVKNLYGTDIIDLIKQMLQFKESLRPSAVSICNTISQNFEKQSSTGVDCELMTNTIQFNSKYGSSSNESRYLSK